MPPFRFSEAEFLENFYGYFIESTATFSTLVFLKKKIISYSSLKLPQLLSGYYNQGCTLKSPQNSLFLTLHGPEGPPSPLQELEGRVRSARNF